MRVIVSWSGPSSHHAAKAIYKWLPLVLDKVEPWISSEDIASGAGWFGELKEALDIGEAAIICVTPSNVHSEWMHYEAGAVAAKVRKPFVCPYLLSVDPSELAGLPLHQYQCRAANEEGTLKLIRDINRAFGEGRTSDNIIEGNFKTRWPELKSDLDRIDFAVAPKSLESQIPVEPLSDEGKRLLRAAARDKGGQVLVTRTSSGFAVQSNGEQFTQLKNARSEAIWRDALKQLVRLGFLEALGVKGEVFQITKKGYEMADSLERENSSGSAE